MNRVATVDDEIRLSRVLISVSDKSGLDLLVDRLVAIPNLEILSTGGTFARLHDLCPAGERHRLIQVSDYTGQPEMQGGLVKTLDFRIYLGLLSEPYNRFHDDDRARLGAGLIDMVVVNLYPFADTVARPDSDAEDARGNIDIGGPCMLRAAAKSYLRVAAVCDPTDYPTIAAELGARDGALTLQTRFQLAKKAFAHTAAYDSAIADYLGAREFPTARAPYTVNRSAGEDDR